MSSELRVDKIIPTAGVPTGGGGGVVQVKQFTLTNDANGGFLSKAARQRKKTLEKSQPGTYFYDLENKVVRKFEGMEDGVPVFIEVAQETFEALPEDAAESNVIKKELTKNEKGTTQEVFEQSTLDATQNIKDRFSWSGEPQGVNPYDENRRITDIVQKTR